MTSLADLTTSLKQDYEPYRVAAEHDEHARKHAALLREHEMNFLSYLAASEGLCKSSCFARVSGTSSHCSCGRQRALERLRKPYQQTSAEMHRHGLSLWSASRLSRELGV